MELYRQLAMEEIEKSHQHVIVLEDSRPILLLQIDQTIQDWQKLFQSLNVSLVKKVIFRLRPKISQTWSQLRILITIHGLHVDVSLPPHEHIEHYSVTIPPLPLRLLVDLLNPVHHLFDPGLAQPLQTLVRLVAQSLISVLALVLVANQLNQHHDTASLKQDLPVLRAVPEQSRQTQTRRLLWVEARAFQLVQKHLNATQFANQLLAKGIVLGEVDKGKEGVEGDLEQTINWSFRVRFVDELVEVCK